MIEIKANTLKQIPLGRRGENLARKIVFDISAWITTYGDGHVVLIHQRPQDAIPFPIAIEQHETEVWWPVTRTDTASSSGIGQCELQYFVGDTLVKSKSFETSVEDAMDEPSEEEPPAPEQGWVAQIVAIGLEAKTSADAANADAKIVKVLEEEVAQNASQVAQNTSDTANAKEAAQTAQRLAEEAQSAAEAARTSAAESAAVYDDVVADVNQLKEDLSQLSEEISNLGGGTGGCYLTVETITIGEESGGTVAVTGLTLDLSTYSATVGDSFYINPVIAPSNATNKAVTWKSSAASIATVDENGYVECVADGDAVITCTTVDGGFTATCAVSIAAAESGGGTDVTMTGISATYSGGDVAVGTSVTELTGIVVTATYSDGSTATVTDYTLSGTIAEGSNTITVSYGGKATTFTVTGVAESTGGKVQLSTLEMTDGLFKADGTIVSLSGTYHVQIPYTEGMFISTGTNGSWNQTNFPAMVVLDNGEYTIPEYTVSDGGVIGVGGKYPTQMTGTLTGHSETAIVYVSFLAGGTKGSNLETNMDKADIYYYIPGGEA